MPGVIIRGGTGGIPDVVSFDRAGNTQDQDLNYQNIPSSTNGYEVTSPGFIAGILIRNSVDAPGDIDAEIYKDGVLLFAETLSAGDDRRAVSFNPTDYQINDRDVLSCRVSGGLANGIRVELKIL